MKTWIIPYIDQPPAFWDEVAARFGDQIRAVYFPLPREVAASGRPPQPGEFMEAFLRHALPKNVLVNPLILPRPAEEVAPAIIAALEHLRDEYGVHSATVTNPTLARLIKEALPEFWVGASTLMGIATPAQALVVQEFVDSIVPDNRLLRDLRGLRQLRRHFAGEISLIVNEACLPGCVYRTQHFYEMAYAETPPPSLCLRTLEDMPWLRLTGGWVLPRHLHYYDGLYDTLKLAGRVTLRDPARYFQVLSAYVNRTALLPRDIGGGPASVLEPMDISDELFEQTLHCDKNCLACPACRDYYEQAVAALGESRPEVGRSL
jgi:hypothetical protein